MSMKLYGIMVKYPEPGRVKTRLATEIGSSRAAEVCRLLAEDVIKKTRPSGSDYNTVIFYDPEERLKDFETWLPGNCFIAQKGSDVGERMDNAVCDLFSMGAKKAVITGTDIPDLTSAIIASAFAALDQNDIVIGPARDGGYYLIGMKTSHSEIFRDIKWSTDHVFDQTVRIINSLGLRLSYTPVLSDIDRLEDLIGLNYMDGPSGPSKAVL